MKDQIVRLTRLVADGKLSPEDAADLIEALYGDQPTEASGDKSDFKGFAAIFSSFDKAFKSGESLDWQAAVRQAQENAKRGVDFVRQTIDEVSRGKVNVGWLTTSESTSVELPLTVPEGKTLRIENVAGSIKITGGRPLGTVKCAAQVRGASLDDAKDKIARYQLVVEESDHYVLIKQPEMTGLTADLQIELNSATPIEIKSEASEIEIIGTGSGVRIHSRSGDIHLEGLNGVIEIHADSGDISVVNAETPSLSIENKSGDVSVSAVRGNVNARTASGDVSAEDVRAKVISLETVAGDIRLQLRGDANGTYNVRTVSGDANVELPLSADLRVGLSTVRGDVVCDIELGDANRTGHRHTGKLGNGMGSLDVSAMTGDIRVLRGN
ncbi:MAG: DUF4097 family beta strand repeat-containing protein [Fimbriimonadaceae bacterium]|nr:DUF4097 family beta strand repeat-containing protein [Fimbriimonadaceae bacterium]